MGQKKKIRDELDKLRLELLRREATPDPRLEAILNNAQADISWARGGMAGGSYKDVYQNQGLAPYLAVYQTAMANRDADRAGQGVRGTFTGNRGGDTGYGKDLQLESETARRTAAAGGLENALSNQYQQALQTTGAGIALNTQRNQGVYSGLADYSREMQQRIANSGLAGFAKGLLKYGLPIASAAMAPFTGGASLGLLGAIKALPSGGVGAMGLPSYTGSAIGGGTGVYG